MARRVSRGIVVLSMAGLACVGSCTSASTGRSAVENNTPAPTFSVHTPIDKIAADQRGKAVLNRDLPGMLDNPSYVMFSSMSLSQVASLSGGKLTPSLLNQVNSDLAELSPGQ